MQASKEEIETVLAYNQAERKRLPQYSKFGDDNWTILDKEIKILKLALAGQLPDPAQYEDDEDSTLWEVCEWLNNTSSSDYGNDRQG